MSEERPYIQKSLTYFFCKPIIDTKFFALKITFNFFCDEAKILFAFPIYDLIFYIQIC